tara:strand:- start:67 stop:450 length:384 start_codon:yes stop_codon:yes gene_type:complete
MLLEMVNGGISDRYGSIVARSPLDGREFHVVFPVCLRTEEATLVFKIIGMLETIAKRHSVKMPFSRMITAVACFFESHGNKRGPFRPASSGIAPREFVAADLLGVVAGEQCCSCGPASRCIVKLGVA